MTRKKTVKKKVEIVFDPQKRKDFLTGFRKRKNERRKRAKDELDRNVKEERKRIRQEIKDGIKHMKKTFEPLRELTDKDKTNEDEYEDDDVKVKIVELSTSDMAAQNHLIGENRTAASESEEDNEDDACNEGSYDDPTCIPGMDFNVNARKRKAAATISNAGSGSEDDETEATSKKHKSNANDKTVDLRSKKDFDRHKKNKTLKKLKQSKVLKMKERIDKTANLKKVKRDKNNTLKSLPKHQRKKKKFEPTRYSKGRMLNKKQLRRQQT